MGFWTLVLAHPSHIADTAIHIDMAEDRLGSRWLHPGPWSLAVAGTLAIGSPNPPADFRAGGWKVDGQMGRKCFTNFKTPKEEIFFQTMISHKKNGERGKLGQERLEVGWKVVMFLFNIVNLNVWLFLFDYLAKCFVEVVVIMFGLNGGRICLGCLDFLCDVLSVRQCGFMWAADFPALCLSGFNLVNFNYSWPGALWRNSTTLKKWNFLDKCEFGGFLMVKGIICLEIGNTR